MTRSREERSRNGGADPVPLPDGGEVWLCGKHFIGPDPETALDRTGATTVVCLNEAAEIEGRYPEYVQWLRGNGPDRVVWYPVPDLHAPDAAKMGELLDELDRRIDAGETLLVHCGAGIGRAGTLATALLVRRGVSLDDALSTVASCRPMAGPEAGAQLDLLRELAQPR